MEGTRMDRMFDAYRDLIDEMSSDRQITTDAIVERIRETESINEDEARELHDAIVSRR